MDDLSKMHWIPLKRMLEERGGAWTNKAKAIADLVAMGSGVVGDTGGKSENPEPPPTPVVKPPAILKAIASGDMIDWEKPMGHVSGEVPGAPSARWAQGKYLYDSEGKKVG